MGTRSARVWMSGIAGACIIAACATTVSRMTHDGSSRTKATRSRVAFVHALPPMDGRHLDVKIMEVTYPPGGSSAPHSHPCPVIGCVLDGALRMQVQGEPESTYMAGQSFFEAPGGVHLISANGSHDRPARFLAYFICDGDTSRAAHE